MALTPKEQSKIIQILGYGGKTIQVGSVIYNKILNDRLNHLPPDDIDLVRSYLGKITAIESKMDSATCRLSATKVDGIELNHDELLQLRGERRRIGREIAEFLDIPFIARGGGNMSVCS